MGSKSQYEKEIDTLCKDSYQRIDYNFVQSLDALHIPHIYGNVIADFPEYASHEVIRYVIACCLRDLKNYELSAIYLFGSGAIRPGKDKPEQEFFVITKQLLPASLTDNDNLLNQWRQAGGALTSDINVVFCDEANYLARKDSCNDGWCEAEHNTGVKCEKDSCICLPSLVSRRGFKLLFIDV